MSDEPLYCQSCGKEIGGFCSGDPCTCPDDVALPERAERYCETCGVVPDRGEECQFYMRGGRISGCVSTRVQ